MPVELQNPDVVYLPWGGNLGFFLKYKAIIGQLIANEMPVATDVQTRIESLEVIIRKKSIPYPIYRHGGIKVPHVHHEGGIYLVDQKKWEDLSSKVLNDFRTKLSETKRVSFKSLMELSEVMDDIS